jgi:hypothetical protein
MKKYMLSVLCVVVLFPVSSYSGNGRNGGPNSNIPKHGGRLQLAQGIEGKEVNFGFNLGGAVTMMDALNREAAPYGAKGSLFVHYLVPRTKTLGIGLEMGAFYLLANQDKFIKNITPTLRDGEPASKNPTTATVGNWLLPVGQVSVMGNFHPVQRFNVQLKVNLGVVAPMLPAYAGEYWNKEFLASTQEYVEAKHVFSYETEMNIGLSGAVGMKLLYALNRYAEFGVGADWSYLRFSYFKKETSPLPIVEKVITQMGIFDLHVGFAFSF